MDQNKILDQMFMEMSSIENYRVNVRGYSFHPKLKHKREQLLLLSLLLLLLSFLSQTQSPLKQPGRGERGEREISNGKKKKRETKT